MFLLGTQYSLQEYSYCDRYYDMISKAFWFVSNTTKSIACVQTSPPPSEKIGRRDSSLLSSPDFFWERGEVCTQPTKSGLFSLVFIQIGKATMHAYVASFPISPLRDLKHQGTLLRINLILVLKMA